jgi:CHAT domain-containing protein
LLLPLWNPPPEVRTELLGSFYRWLRRAPDRAAALHRAMLEIKQRHPHPYYWASFSLIGDPGPMSPGSRPEAVAER